MDELNIKKEWNTGYVSIQRSNTLSMMKNIYKLVDLIHLSKTEDTVTIEATVDTGFEKLAEEECRSKLGVQLPICVERGRVYFNIPASRYFLVSMSCGMIYLFQ